MVWYIFFFFNYFNGILSLRVLCLLKKLLLITWSVTILILLQLPCDKQEYLKSEAAVIKYFRINGLLLQQGKKKVFSESKNVANTAVTFRGLDSEKLSMDTPLHSSACCSFLVILQNQISLSRFRREFLDLQIKYGHLKQNLGGKKKESYRCVYGNTGAARTITGDCTLKTA